MMSRSGDSASVSVIKEIRDESEMYIALSQANGRPLLACFSAAWCMPCRAFAPKLRQLADKYSRVAFVKLDVDKMRNLADQHGIEMLPTFVLFKNGYRAGSASGTADGRIEALLAAHGIFPTNTSSSVDT